MKNLFSWGVAGGVAMMLVGSAGMLLYAAWGDFGASWHMKVDAVGFVVSVVSGLGLLVTVVMEKEQQE